jgi:hypothetical protein
MPRRPSSYMGSRYELRRGKYRRRSITIRYRTWGDAIPPRRTRIEIPGWAGEPEKRQNGAVPQPWHCEPFVEAASYGYELLFPWAFECRVANIDGDLNFSIRDLNTGEALSERPPFSQFAPNHYGMTSCVDIAVPRGWVLRVEPHPRVYTDMSYTAPLAVTGHIRRFWSRIFFVVFKRPAPGQTHIFRYSEPYCQILIVPEDVRHGAFPMSESIQDARAQMGRLIGELAPELSAGIWHSEDGAIFDDKYRRLNAVYRAGGVAAVKKLVDDASIANPPDVC